MKSEQASEAAQIGHHFRTKGGPHMRLNSLDKFITGIDIDPGITVGSHRVGILAMQQTLGQQRESEEDPGCSKRSYNKAAGEKEPEAYPGVR